MSANGTRCLELCRQSWHRTKRLMQSHASRTSSHFPLCQSCPETGSRIRRGIGQGHRIGSTGSGTQKGPGQCGRHWPPMMHWQGLAAFPGHCALLERCSCQGRCHWYYQWQSLRQDRSSGSAWEPECDSERQRLVHRWYYKYARRVGAASASG